MSWFNDYARFNECYVDTCEVHGITTATKLNRILAKDIKMSFHKADTQRNNHTVVIADKYKETARSYIIPNINNHGCNYIISDKNGFVFNETREALFDAGYTVHHLNLSNMVNTISFNPFLFLKKNPQMLSQNINQLVKIMVNSGYDNGEIYFEDAEKMLLSAILYYYVEIGAKFHISDVLYTLKRVWSYDFEKDLDSTKHSDGMSQKCYETFVRNSGKSRDAMIKSLLIRLMPFSTADCDMTMYDDTFDFNVLKKDKQAVFITYDDKDEFVKIRQMFDWALLQQFTLDYQNQMGIQYETYTMWFYDDTSKMFDEYLPTFTQVLGECGIGLSAISDKLPKYLENVKYGAASLLTMFDTVIYLNSTNEYGKEFVKKLLASNKKISNRDISLVDNMPSDKCIVHVRGILPFFETRATSQQNIFDFSHCFEE